MEFEQAMASMAADPRAGDHHGAVGGPSEAAAARILEIQKRVKPDPEGWTIRDYIDRGRP